MLIDWHKLIYAWNSFLNNNHFACETVKVLELHGIKFLLQDFNQIILQYLLD